ncbi:MAG: hypothetical protein V4624_02480 [Pseudomonadota bacterium]
MRVGLSGIVFCERIFFPKKISAPQSAPNNFLVFIKSSFGEVFVVLPMLYFLKKHRPNIYITFVFNDSAVYNAIAQVAAYKDVLQSLGQVVVGLHAFIWKVLMKSHQSEPLYMLTCDNGIETLQRMALTYFAHPVPIFFHHAYALHINDDQNKKQDLHRAYIIGSCVLANNRDDKLHYRAMCFEEKNIFFTGAQGYRDEWLAKIVCHNPFKTLSEYRKIVFIPIRPPHILYLTESNYQRQLEGLGQAAGQFRDYLFVIKMHPRQNIDLKLHQLTQSHANIIIRDESTLELAAHADLTLSFWSSAILDSLAVNTPAVEFHYHEVMHSQLVVSHNGKLESLYVNQGFCSSISSLEELLDVLARFDVNSNFKIRKENFDDFFGLKISGSILAKVFDDIYIEYTMSNKRSISIERSRFFRELLKTLLYGLMPNYFFSKFSYLWRGIRRSKN